MVGVLFLVAFGSQPRYRPGGPQGKPGPGARVPRGRGVPADVVAIYAMGCPVLGMGTIGIPAVLVPWARSPEAPREVPAGCGWTMIEIQRLGPEPACRRIAVLGNP